VDGEAGAAQRVRAHRDRIPILPASPQATRATCPRC
jgi:hypothetical protein